MITFTGFKKKYPVGSSIASPEGGYLGECVSYVRQYMLQVQGFSSPPLGHAAQIPFNPVFLKSYEKVKTPRVGDLMFWGDDPGTWTGKYGHTAIFDGNGMMMNQNYNNSGKISRDSIFTPGFIGYYRKKETMVDKSQVEYLARTLFGRPANKTDLSYVGKLTWGQLLAKFKATTTYKSRVLAAKNGKLNAVNHLEYQMRSVYKAPDQTNSTVLQPGKYEVK